VHELHLGPGVLGKGLILFYEVDSDVQVFQRQGVPVIAGTVVDLVAVGMRVACIYRTVYDILAVTSHVTIDKVLTLEVDAGLCYAFGAFGGEGLLAGGGGGPPEMPPPPLPPPPSDIYVIGRIPDVEAFMAEHGTEGCQYYLPEPGGTFSEAGSAQWVQQGVSNGNTFQLVSPIDESNILNYYNPGGFTVLAEELSQLFRAGYQWLGSGDFLVP
jgi:hypothetical protein